MDTTIDKKESHLLAVYGTLRPSMGNNKNYLRGSIHVGTGLTKGSYKMTAQGIPFVTKKESNARIVVDIYSVDDETLKDIDRLEGHPDWYKREETEVELNGKIITAWLYFNDGYSNLPEITTGDYLNR